jgi:hypothetical protein
MPKFEVAMKVPYDLVWKLNGKDLNFEFQTQTKFIL